MSTTDKPIFTGPMIGHYDQYLGPLFFEPYALEIASRIDSSNIENALELASGTGRVTRHLRSVLKPDTSLIASDISPEILTFAKEKLHSENIDWQIIDAQQLPFLDNTFDLVVCCFGFMFLPDKVMGFKEAFRILRPGGTLLISTWDTMENNPASNIYRKTVKQFLGEPLPANYKLPFAMNDEEEIRAWMQEAGFTSISVEKVEKQSISPSAAEAAIGLTMGGSIYNEVVKRNPAWVDEIRQIVEKELTEKYGAAPMISPMQALISEAKK